VEDSVTDVARPGTLVSVTALISLVFFDVLRVWLPSLLFVVGDAGSTSATVMGGIAVAIMLVAPLVCALLGAATVRIGWPLGVVLLLAGRLLLQASDGGPLQFAASSIAVVGAGIAFGVIGAAAPSGRQARIAVLLGIVGSVVIHTGLGTTDLVWRDGPAAWATLIVLLGATLIAARDGREVLNAEHAVVPGPAWPWWLMGPVLVLLGVLTAPPGRIVTATEWPDVLTVSTVIVAHGAAIMAAISARWFGPAVAGATGAGLVLFGTAGSLQAASIIAVAAQVLLAVGLGLIVGAMARADAEVGARRRSIAAAGFPLAFVLVGFLYYAGYDLVLPFPRRAVLLVTSAIVAGAGLYIATAEVRPALRERGTARQVMAVAAATAATAGVAAALVVSPAPMVPAPDAPGEEIGITLYNIHMGFDPEGRMSLGEIGDVLDATDADIVVLNEVDRGWLTTGSREPLQMLQERLGMPYVFAPAADEIWGNAVFSRYPITEVSIERLPRGRDAMARSQLIVVMEVEPERRVALIATHLSHVDVQGDTRLPQARAVAGTLARLQERGVPVIVAGDLNAQPDDAELATFGDVARSAIPQSNPTFPSTAPEVQIDHILVTQELDVVGFDVPQSQASDHLPVSARLVLQPRDED
jgi:endonuclease/exonuclease/phosphatase family metal-dependent hydrolase